MTLVLRKLLASSTFAIAGNSVFGVGCIVRLLREPNIGCTCFEVDTARRENNNGGVPNYTNFRFDQRDNGAPIINKYHEVWCFGFNPDNNAGPDANITQASALPTSDDELKVLAQWMNDRRGGLLAMGDHDYLGASMCHRIPRIRSMRRWTNAQGVPPIGDILHPDTSLRHDTNQPFTAAQINGTAVIPFEVQEDSKPAIDRLGAMDRAAGVDLSNLATAPSGSLSSRLRSYQRDARSSA